jgi:hypothetical protein
MMTVIAILIWLVANYQLLANHAPKSFLGFFFAIICMTLIMGQHLKRLIKSNSSALLPHYRRDQLLAAGLILPFFVIWPAILLGFFSFPVLRILALFLFTSSIILWSTFRYGDNLLVLLVLVWLIRLNYELVDMPLQLNLTAYFLDFWPLNSPNMMAIIFILISVYIYMHLVKNFNRISILDFENANGDESDPWAKDYDRAGGYTKRMAKKMLNSLTNISHNIRQRPIHFARMFQFALFSPGFVVYYNAFMLVVALLYMGSILLILYSEIDKNPRYIIPILLLVYHMAAVFLSTDFLQHRGRLPFLWLNSQLPTKRSFSKSIVLSYLLVAWKQYIVITVIYTFLLILLSYSDLRGYIFLYTFGAFVFTVIPLLSLLFSNLVISADAKGWMIFNIVMAFIVVLILFRIWHLLSSTHLIIALAVCLFFIWAAIGKWENIEMDFSSPEMNM